MSLDSLVLFGMVESVPQRTILYRTVYEEREDARFLSKSHIFPSPSRCETAETQKFLLRTLVFHLKSTPADVFAMLQLGRRWKEVYHRI